MSRLGDFTRAIQRVLVRVQGLARGVLGRFFPLEERQDPQLLTREVPEEAEILPDDGASPAEELTPKEPEAVLPVEAPAEDSRGRVASTDSPTAGARATDQEAPAVSMAEVAAPPDGEDGENALAVSEPEQSTNDGGPGAVVGALTVLDDAALAEDPVRVLAGGPQSRETPLRVVEDAEVGEPVLLADSLAEGGIGRTPVPSLLNDEEAVEVGAREGSRLRVRPTGEPDAATSPIGVDEEVGGLLGARGVEADHVPVTVGEDEVREDGAGLSPEGHSRRAEPATAHVEDAAVGDDTAVGGAGIRDTAVGGDAAVGDETAIRDDTAVDGAASEVHQARVDSSHGPDVEGSVQAAGGVAAGREKRHQSERSRSVRKHERSIPAKNLVSSARRHRLTKGSPARKARGLRMALGEDRIRSIVESLLLISPEPVPVARLVEVIRIEDPQTEEETIRASIDDLVDNYGKPDRPLARGFRVEEVAGGLQLRTVAENAPFVRRYLAAKPQRLSKAALETLSIVAYRQPVTKPEIETIRGVDAGAALRSLLDRELVKIIGKRDEVGRPLIYGTTPYFLEFFSLKALGELPTLREFHELDEASMEEVSALDGAAPTVQELAEAAHFLVEREDDPDLEALDEAVKAAEAAKKAADLALDPTGAAAPEGGVDDTKIPDHAANPPDPPDDEGDAPSEKEAPSAEEPT